MALLHAYDCLTKGQTRYFETRRAPHGSSSHRQLNENKISSETPCIKLLYFSLKKVMNVFF